MWNVWAEILQGINKRNAVAALLLVLLFVSAFVFFGLKNAKTPAIKQIKTTAYIPILDFKTTQTNFTS